MNSPRVLLVLDALYVGGTETHVLSLAKELIKNKTFVAIVAEKKGSLFKSFEALKCPLYHLEFPNTLNLEQKQEDEHIKRIEEIIEHDKISLVHFHQTPSGYLAGKAARNKGIATLFTVHGTYYPEHEIRKLLDLSDSVVCVSPPLRNYLKSLSMDDTFLVANGIDLEEYPISSSVEIRNQLKIPKDAVVVFYGSRITWAKANVCTILLKACKDLKLNSIPNLHVIIVGDGNRLCDIRNLAENIEKTCKDSFIHIVGEQQNMKAYYSAADIVVGTGRVALEAMACEKPVIAVGNHGYFGIVKKDNFKEAWDHYFGDHSSISPCSRYILSQDLNKILSDKDHLKEIGLDSRKFVEENFNIQDKSKELIKIYSDTIGSDHKMKKVLYIGWLGFNNLGDELLWNLFKDTCCKYIDCAQIEITPTSPGMDLKKIEKYDTVVLGGGSLLLPGYLQILQNAIQLGKNAVIWGSGLDWIEKKNLDLLIDDQLLSLEQNFKQKDIEILDEVIEKASFVGVRGPLTKKAIELMLGMEKAKNVQIIGDPGLILQDSNHKMIENKKDKWIGINWGTTINRLYGANESLVEEQIVRTAKELIKSGNKIMIYAVWNNDIEHCQRLYEKINDPMNVVLDKTLYTEHELISILSKCTATINLKLHANLLSLTAGVPAIALGYRFKVFDFAAMLELQNLVVSTDSPQLETELLDRVAYMDKNGATIIKKYQSIQKTYVPLLESLFTQKILS